MKALNIEASFDPITQKELEEIRRLKKQANARMVYVWPTGDGVLSIEERFELLKLALKPYRHLQAGSGKGSTTVRLSEEVMESEQEVRTGRFHHAAAGIRGELVRKMYYFETAVAARCTPHRAAHSRSVAAFAAHLAQVHHMDCELAWRAGILHDITKAWSKEEGERILRVYAPKVLEYPPAVYHSYTAPVFLKTVMGITDHRILQAIETHTLGNGHTDLDYLLYIADKIEPTRGYDTARETALAEKDLRAAFDLVFREAEQYRQKEN